MKPYLGDCPGDEPVYRAAPIARSRSRFAAILDTVVGIIGVGFYMGLVVIILVIIFTTFAAQNRAMGQAVDIPEACRPLARLVGLNPAPSREEAALAFAELMKPEYDKIAAVRACRDALPKRHRIRLRG